MGVLVDDDLFPDLGEHALDGLQIDAAFRDLRGFLVSAKRAVNFATSPSASFHTLGGVALGLADLLLGLAAGLGISLLYWPLATLMDFSRSCWAWFTSLNEAWTGRGWIHVLELHLVDRDAHVVKLHQILEQLLRFDFDLLPADRDDLVHGAVPHDLAHHGFGGVAQGSVGIADLELEGGRIRDAVLDDPFDQGGVSGSPVTISFSRACSSVELD